MEWFKKQISGKKGFTLVEIIVVLVVLAVLAAFTIPSMLGFVEDAKGKAYIVEAREVYVAAQAAATEFSGITYLTDSENYEWYGLSNCLGSRKIYQRKDYLPTHDDYNDARVQASLRMFNYLSPDIIISSIDVSSSTVLKPVNLETGASAWRVTVGTDPSNGKTGKVNKIVYFKNGYRITIESNNATVEKY